jgi:hypothetical protein
MNIIELKICKKLILEFGFFKFPYLFLFNCNKRCGTIYFIGILFTYIIIR